MTEFNEDQRLIAWADTLGTNELDYLYEEALKTFAADQQQFSSLDSKIVAMVGWALVGIGTLLIADALEFRQTAEGLAAGVVVGGASVAMIAGVFALWPRNWASALDLRWYSGWEGPTAQSMKARSLAELIRGADINRDTLQRRSLALRGAAVGLTLEFTALIAAVIAKSVGT